MKLLWLGTSNDAVSHLAETQRAPHRAAQRVSELLSLEVESEVRPIWPTEHLPSLVQRWMEKGEPDLVLLKIPDYWICYESVPLKIQRTFGVLGKPVAAAGLRAADIGWLSSNRVFHAGRRLAQRTIGGATNFEPEEVVERMSSCIRTILRSEKTALLVQGPIGLNNYGQSGGARRRNEARRRYVHRHIGDLCEELHATYFGSETPMHEARRPSTVGDRVHFDGAQQQFEAERLAHWLKTAWEQQHSEATDVRSRPTV